MIGPAPMCMYCARLNRATMATCEAYPGGIPDEIIETQEWDHRAPKPGDHGLQFVPKEPGVPPDWWWEDFDEGGVGCLSCAVLLA